MQTWYYMPWMYLTEFCARWLHLTKMGIWMKRMVALCQIQTCIWRAYNCSFNLQLSWTMEQGHIRKLLQDGLYHQCNRILPSLSVIYPALGWYLWSLPSNLGSKFLPTKEDDPNTVAFEKRDLLRDSILKQSNSNIWHCMFLTSSSFTPRLLSFICKVWTSSVTC